MFRYSSERKIIKIGIERLSSLVINLAQHKVLGDHVTSKK